MARSSTRFNCYFPLQKMSASLKFRLLILIYVGGAQISARKADLITKDDIPYDVINIEVPQSIWRQAFKPTPVLRSPVTIVLPVHVPEENEVDDEYLDEEVVNTTVANDEVLQDEDATLAPVTSEDTVVSEAPISEAPVSDPPAQQPVEGQVFRFPCSCINGQCGCCTGAFLDRYRMKTCGNLTFIPEDFVFDVRLSVNNNTVVQQRVSASDPPPICFNPRRAPFVQVCAEISNIRIRDRNAYACLDINADIGGFNIYSASFRCFGLGASGVQSGLKPKPVSSGPTPINIYGNTNNDDDRGSFLQNAAGALFGGGEGGGIFGGEGGFFGGGGGGSDNDDEGPLDGIGDALGDFFDGRSIKV